MMPDEGVVNDRIDVEHDEHDEHDALSITSAAASLEGLDKRGGGRLGRGRTIRAATCSAGEE